MVRVTMEFFEEVVPCSPEEQLTALAVGILKYSRDLRPPPPGSGRRCGRGTRQLGQPDGSQREGRGGTRRHHLKGLRAAALKPATVLVTGTPAPGSKWLQQRLKRRTKTNQDSLCS